MMHIRQRAMMGVMARWRVATRAKAAVAIALCFSALATGRCDAQAVVDKGAVVTLPGLNASSDAPGCAEADGVGAATLPFDCLNRAVTPTSAPSAVLPQDADLRHRPTNQLGLYNAAALGHRMGPNLGTSAQPYRPKVTYPTPLVPSH
jgi:hypothetical protein